MSDAAPICDLCGKPDCVRITRREAVRAADES